MNHLPSLLAGAAVLLLWHRAGILWPKAGAACRSLRRAGLFLVPHAWSLGAGAVGLAHPRSALYLHDYEPRRIAGGGGPV